jgi:outer membrane usher protein FimD/PapC
MAIPDGRGGIDTPDYGIGAILSGFPKIPDMGELAVRLGSPSIYDRYGNIIHMETFKNGMGNWLAAAINGATTPYLVADYALHDYYAVNLNVAKQVSSMSYISRTIPFSSLSNMGIEISFNPLALFDSLRITFDYSDGTTELTAGIQISANDNVIYYYNSSGGYTSMGTWDFSYLGLLNWHTAKFTVNMNTKKYLRCSINSVNYDIGGQDIYPWGVADYPYLTPTIYLHDANVIAADVIVDSIIITTNEPT